ncbi:MAG: alpha/beta hydrolase [Clostridiales bacterium]|nr:alpha/beta hydrolase [Clostridiales bacterium]
MKFDTEINNFMATHTFKQIKVDGIGTRYLLCGNEGSKYTLVYLVGGTGIPEVWLNHILKMEKDFRILTMDYPMEIESMEVLARHIVHLVDTLYLRNTIFIGASLGGFVAQLIGRIVPERAAGVCLYSTCSLSETSVVDLKKQYKSYGVMLVLMKILPYSWVRILSLNISKKQIGLENEDQVGRTYMEDLFTWVFNRYTKEFDTHMTKLLADIPNLDFMTKEDYARFDDRSLLVLPKNDKAFSEAAQKDLRDCMPHALVKWVNAGHTATLFKVDTYVDATREFIKGLEGADAS